MYIMKVGKVKYSQNSVLCLASSTVIQQNKVEMQLDLRLWGILFHAQYHALK